MTLQVFTARLGRKDHDALDVTRKSGCEGIFLAPSWSLLGPALRARREAEELEQAGQRVQAERLEEDAWAKYEPAFVAEMRASYMANRANWDALLARPRVILLCYCVDAEHCHRRILRADILPKLGAVDAGELPAIPRKARACHGDEGSPMNPPSFDAAKKAIRELPKGARAAFDRICVNDDAGLSDASAKRLIEKGIVERYNQQHGIVTIFRHRVASLVVHRAWAEVCSDEHAKRRGR